jgi:hypothetical protein
MQKFNRYRQDPLGRPLWSAAAVLIACIFLCAPSPIVAAQADSREVLAAIVKGANYLLRESPRQDQARADMGVLGLLKSGASPDDPTIQKVVNEKLLTKFVKNEYQPSNGVWYIYEAGVDLMVLANCHPESHRKEMEILVNAILDKQDAGGYWDYLPFVAYHDQGDTSITQYALLGLWEAERAGIHIPNSVWDKAASWLCTHQDSDGGFWYHPGNPKYPPTNSMVAAGIANVLVCRLMLHGDANFSTGKRDNKSRFGVLTKLDLNRPPEIHTRHRADGAARTGRSTMDNSAKRGFSWLDENWDGPKAGYYRCYFCYALERACTLAHVERIGEHDWYDEISNQLLKDQNKDGSWGDHENAGTVPNTAFIMLFLSRATARLLAHDQPKVFGGGLMIGGRGLPTNLSSIQTSAEGIQVKKLDAPVDQLLSELENPKSANVEAAQQAIVERVETGDREGLVGQRDRLTRLARDPRPEVRRTAIWALGRCATIHEAHILVKALDDPDLGVVIEAHNALCWFSRRPNAFGHHADPFADLPENATDRRKEDAAKTWRNRVRTDWRNWFESVRPYAERNLPIDLP